MKKSNLNSKSGFTMIELVFVIVMIGILAAVLIPRSRDNRLREAADQIVSHIRYTQHLAMMDDKFDPDPAKDDWYKGRWQILFERDAADNIWAYTIFSDGSYVPFISGGGAVIYDGNPMEAEIARNPQDSSKRLTGGSVLGGIASNDAIVTKDLNLGRTYDIRGADGIVFDANCDNTAGGAGAASTRIVFDYIGRPIQGSVSADTSPYPNNRLITDLCTITLTDGSGRSANITIEPETGFAQVIPF